MAESDLEKRFAKFVEDETQKASAPAPFDVEEEKSKWLADLDGLYGSIKGFLAEYIQAGTVKISTEENHITEELLGTYRADNLIILIGKSHYRLHPVGTFMIGTRGRVDVEGPIGGFRFMLLDRTNPRPQVRITVTQEGQEPPKKEPSRKPDWVWWIVTSGPPHQFIKFEKDNVLNALLRIANGPV